MRLNEDTGFEPVKRWLTGAEPTPTIHLQDSAVNGPAFSPNGKLLATADGDGTVRLWNPLTGQPVGTPLHAVTAQGGTGESVNGVAFSPNGKLLASADGDGTVGLWQVQVASHPYAGLCSDVGPPTQQNWDQYAPGEPRSKICT